MPTSVEGNQIFGPITKAKTASYTCTSGESGVMFTTRGATAAITFSLPLPSACPIGTTFQFYSVSAYGMVVSCAASLNVVNNAAASTITCTTSANIIGANVKVVNDGTTWLTWMGTGPSIAAYAIG